MEFEQRIIERYTDFRDAMGWRYVGLYDLEPVGPALAGDLAVVYAVDAPTADAALALQQQAPAPPTEIVAFGAECSSYKANAGDWLWLEPVARAGAA